MKALVYDKMAKKRSVESRVYLDNAASAPMDPRVLGAMTECLVSVPGNPGSLHKEGLRARETLDDARLRIAKIVGVHSDEIVFTSGGTEASNLAIFGTAKKFDRGHIITTAIEHHSVLEPMRRLEKEGFFVTYLKVGENGIVDPAGVRRALRNDTILVSVMYVNNEIGTIQPIGEIAKTLRHFRRHNKGVENNDGQAVFLKIQPPPYFHVDACQAPGLLPLDLAKLGVDMFSASAQKFYGPKGVGFLFARRGVDILPIILGGGQELGRRSGTENVCAAVATALALEISEKARAKEVARLEKLRDYLLRGIKRLAPDVTVNGDEVRRTASNINISMPGVLSEMMLFDLDAHGFAVSSGSACMARGHESSHVIKALGGDADRFKTSLRITLGRLTKKNDLTRFLKILPGLVEKNRRFKGEQ